MRLVCHYPEDLKAEQYFLMIRKLIIDNKVKKIVPGSSSALHRIYSEEKLREFIIGPNAFLKMHNITSVLTNTTSQLLRTTEVFQKLKIISCTSGRSVSGR